MPDPFSLLRQSSPRRRSPRIRLISTLAALISLSIIVAGCGSATGPVDPAAGPQVGATDAGLSGPGSFWAAPFRDGSPENAPVWAHAPGSGAPVDAVPALPGGGQEFFPGRRLVALYGHPGSPGLGALGEQGPDASISRVEALAAQYAPLSDVPVVPTLEIIATVAQQDPGPDGDYSQETDAAALRPWIERAQAAGVYVLLDLQPGRAGMIDQARRYEKLLRYPNVGLALDPEWKLLPGQRPLQQVGRVEADEINAVGDWLDGVIGDDRPQTLLVVHQFQAGMVQNQDRLVYERPHVQTLMHMDGQGTSGAKEETWAAVRDAAPPDAPLGWKNFLRIDTPVYGPEATMDRRPQPLMISYQ